MQTVYIVTIVLIMAGSTMMDPAAVKRDPTPSYGYNNKTPWITAWMKTIQKQSAPPHNSIAQDTKIPAWVNPWTSQPHKYEPAGQPSSPIKRQIAGDGRNPWGPAYVAHRFRAYKDDRDDLEDKMKKRAHNFAQWFRFNHDVDMKRGEDLMRGLNSVPMMGKRLYQYLCQECT